MFFVRFARFLWYAGGYIYLVSCGCEILFLIVNGVQIEGNEVETIVKKVLRLIAAKGSKAQIKNSGDLTHE